MNYTKYRGLFTPLVFTLAMSAVAPALAQKAALVRDIDRTGSAGAAMVCTANIPDPLPPNFPPGNPARCTLTPPVPVGKRFVTSYVSYIIQAGTFNTKIITAYLDNGNFTYLPVPAPIDDGSGNHNVYTMGSPMVMVFEALAAPVFVPVYVIAISPSPPSSVGITVQGHYECVTTGPC